DGVNGRAVVQRLEASRTLLVLEIVGKPHTKSPRCFFLPACDTTLAPSCCPCPVLCAMQVRCSRMAQAGLARRNSARPAPYTHVARAWYLVAQRGSPSRSYPEESGKGLSYREVGRAKKGESPTLAGDRSTSPMPTTRFSTPLFCPLSSMELADVCILVRAGYARGETGRVGTLLIDRRIEMLSVERAHKT